MRWSTWSRPTRFTEALDQILTLSRVQFPQRPGIVRTALRDTSSPGIDSGKKLAMKAGFEVVTSGQDLERLHHDSHDQCYIANSVKTDISVRSA